MIKRYNNYISKNKLKNIFFIIFITNYFTPIDIDNL